METRGTPLLKKQWVQTLLASVICVLIGLAIGYIVLLIINPNGAWKAVTDILKNFMTYSSPALQMKNFGNTLVKTAPLLMCGLSVLFAYKVGLFNIGASGQYLAGACAALYAALAFKLPWYACMLLALAVGAVWGSISGLLKAYLNVNEVISGIMLNWISLYTANTLLSNVKDPGSPYTMAVGKVNASAIIPSLGLGNLFGNNKYVTIAIPLAVIISVVIFVVLNNTKSGYVLKATGLNRYAAQYSGMHEKANIIIAMGVSGALAGIGASMLYLTGFETWLCTQSSVPDMGFLGIAAAFLGGMNPLGVVISSYFIQHIASGGAYVDKAIYSPQISDFICSIVIYQCSFVALFKHFLSHRRRSADGREPRAKDDRLVKESAE